MSIRIVKQIVISATLLCSQNLWSQIGIGTTNPASSAKLEISSTSKGFLPPRMTASDKNAISSPQQEVDIFNLLLGA